MTSCRARRVAVPAPARSRVERPEPTPPAGAAPASPPEGKPEVCRRRCRRRASRPNRWPRRSAHVGNRHRASACLVALHAVALDDPLHRSIRRMTDDSAAARRSRSSTRKSASKPAKADILAQANLDGGGNTDADRRAKTPLPVLPKRHAPAKTSPSRRSARGAGAADARDDDAASLGRRRAGAGAEADRRRASAPIRRRRTR